MPASRQPRHPCVVSASFARRRVPRRPASLVLLAALLLLVPLGLGLLGPSASVGAIASDRRAGAGAVFSDVDPNSASPYAVAIYELARRGIVSGYNDGTSRFGPLDPVLRAQAAAIVVRALGWQGEVGHATFRDRDTVDDDLWNSVRVLADKGVAHGYADGTYRPLNQVTEAQFISLITRAMVAKGLWQYRPDNRGLYPDVPANSGHRVDVVTYDSYTGGLPFAHGKGAQLWTTWADGAERRAVALATWNAIKLVPALPGATQSTRPSPTATATAALQAAPVAGQPCPARVHDRYTATGPDRKQYATWHPAVDAKYGCTFGHEHGDDPTGAPALKGRPVLFGYAAAQAGMTEPHVGFKVFRWDNVQSTNGPSHNGASLLMMLHQGTTGAGRFTAVHHDVQVDYVNARDGREVHVHMLAPFGTLAVGCGANAPNLVTVRQAPVPGMRQVSGPQCFGAARYPDTTGVIPGSIPYEDWLTALYVGRDAQGNYAAYLDPHFAIFNPNTYCEWTGSGCTLGYSDVRAGKGIDPASTASQFKGSKREAYLNQAWLKNAGGSTTIWTDPYGNAVAPGTPGAIAQYVAAVEVAPLVDSSAFGADNEHDPDGSVHAPN